MAVVSVIVPVYDTMQWLADCVESIRSQTLQDIEIVLVDDGSMDFSGAICDAYAEMDSRIQVLHQENKGVSSARNAGMDIASGKYIMFCDSDDYVAPEWCACAVELAEAYPDAMISLTFAHIDINGIHCKLHDEGNECTIFRRGSYLDFLKSSRSIHTSNKIFRKNILEQYRIKFDEALSNVEDSCFVASYLERKKYIVLRNISPLCYYRIWSKDSLSHRFLGIHCFNAFRCEAKVWHKLMTEEEELEFQKWLFWAKGIGGLCYIKDSRNPDPLEKQLADCQEIVNSAEFKEWCMAAVPEDTSEPMLQALRQGDFYEAYEPFMKWLIKRNIWI